MTTTDEANEAILQQQMPNLPVLDQAARQSENATTAAMSLTSKAAYIVECEPELRLLDRELQQLEALNTRGLPNDSNHVNRT